MDAVGVGGNIQNRGGRKGGSKVDPPQQQIKGGREGKRESDRPPSPNGMAIYLCFFPPDYLAPDPGHLLRLGLHALHHALRRLRRLRHGAPHLLRHPHRRLVFCVCGRVRVGGLVGEGGREGPVYRIRTQKDIIHMYIHTYIRTYEQPIKAVGDNDHPTPNPQPHTHTHTPTFTHTQSKHPPTQATSLPACSPAPGPACHRTGSWPPGSAAAPAPAPGGAPPSSRGPARAPRSGARPPSHARPCPDAGSSPGR